VNFRGIITPKTRETARITSKYDYGYYNRKRLALLAKLEHNTLTLYGAMFTVAERNQSELRGCEGWYIFKYNKHNYNHKYKYSI
jgi:hypothetical protein